MLPKALKSCPKSNKSHNLVTLVLAFGTQIITVNQDFHRRRSSTPRRCIVVRRRFERRRSTFLEKRGCALDEGDAGAVLLRPTVAKERTVLGVGDIVSRMANSGANGANANSICHLASVTMIPVLSFRKTVSDFITFYSFNIQFQN